MEIKSRNTEKKSKQQICRSGVPYFMTSCLYLLTTNPFQNGISCYWKNEIFVASHFLVSVSLLINIGKEMSHSGFRPMKQYLFNF